MATKNEKEKFEEYEDTKKSKGGKRRNRKPSGRGVKPTSRNANRKMDSSESATTNNRARYTHNDASWWNKFGNLTDIACNLSWNVMNGAPRVRSFTADTLTTQADTVSRVLPTDMGISIIETIPGLGACRQIGDPINKACIEIYNMVRWDKNQYVPYTQADIGKLLWCYDSFVSYMACMRRIYALSNAVDPRNRYVATSILTAMGVDQADVYANRAQLVYKINQLSIQAAKINIPAEFKVFDRHELLYDNVFIDAPIARGTFYAFVPRKLAKYTDTNDSIDYVDFLNGKNETTMSSAITAGFQDDKTTHVWTVAELCNLGDELLDAIQLSEDFYMLNANIYGAYSKRGLHPVRVIDSFYTITPLFREEVLLQIHNADFVHVSLDSLSVLENTTEGDPDAGALEFTPSVSERQGLMLGYNKIVDVEWEDPSKDDVLQATRLKATAVQDPAKIHSTTGWYVDSCGTEIATCMYVFFFQYEAGYWNLNWYPARGYVLNALANHSTVSHNYAWFQFEAALTSKIDHYPMATVFSVIVTDGSVTTITPTFQLGNIDNYAMLDTNQLHNIHTAALLSVLLNGPTVGSGPVSETR